MTLYDQDLSDIIENLSSLALKDSGSPNTNGPQVLNSDRHKPATQSSSDDSEIQSRKAANIGIHRKQSVDKVMRYIQTDAFIDESFHFRDGKTVYLHILILALVSLPIIKRATLSIPCHILIKQSVVLWQSLILWSVLESFRAAVSQWWLVPRISRQDSKL